MVWFIKILNRRGVLQKVFLLLLCLLWEQNLKAQDSVEISVALGSPLYSESFSAFHPTWGLSFARSKHIEWIDVYAGLDLLSTQFDESWDVDDPTNADAIIGIDIEGKEIISLILRSGVRKLIPLFKIKKKRILIGGSVFGLLNVLPRGSVRADVSKYLLTDKYKTKQNNIIGDAYSPYSVKTVRARGSSYSVVGFSYSWEIGLYKQIGSDGSGMLFVSWGQGNLDIFQNLRGAEIEGQSLDERIPRKKGIESVRIGIIIEL